MKQNLEFLLQNRKSFDTVNERCQRVRNATMQPASCRHVRRGDGVRLPQPGLASATKRNIAECV